VSGEALLAAGYAGFLLAAAAALDLLARHSHDRSLRYRTAGFTFRPEHDLWVCPEGEHLRRVDTDHALRVARYRASPAVCNACPVKQECTDSAEGREISRALDPWPHSEAGRFHRGLCVMLGVLACVVAAIGLARAEATADLMALAALLGGSIAVTGRLASAFARTPSGFPAGPS
jgi:hypothetical protein